MRKSVLALVLAVAIVAVLAGVKLVGAVNAAVASRAVVMEVQ